MSKAEGMFRIIRKLITSTIIAGLVASNILSITNDRFNQTLSDLITRIAKPLGNLVGSADEFVSIREKHNKQMKKLSADLANTKKELAIIKANPKLTTYQKKFAGEIAEKIKVRNMRRVAASSSAIFLESVPYIGIAAIVAETGYEIVGYCQTFNDMNELYSTLGIGQAVDESTIYQVCNPSLPDTSEVQRDIRLRWDSWGMAVFSQLVTIKEFWGQAWKKWGDFLIDEIFKDFIAISKSKTGIDSPLINT